MQESEYADVALSCAFCGDHFIWTEGEQLFIKALVDAGKKNRDGTPVVFNTPRRCADCRRKKREMFKKQEERYPYSH